MVKRTYKTVDVVRGQRYTHVMPWSEVCLHMKVADKPMQFELCGGETYPMVQLFKLSGEVFSSPILPGEAGLIRRADGTYYFGFYE